MSLLMIISLAVLIFILLTIVTYLIIRCVDKYLDAREQRQLANDCQCCLENSCQQQIIENHCGEQPEQKPFEKVNEIKPIVNVYICQQPANDDSCEEDIEEDVEDNAKEQSEGKLEDNSQQSSQQPFNEALLEKMIENVVNKAVDRVIERLPKEQDENPF